MALNELAYSQDIVWIAYDVNKYEPAKLKPIDTSDPWCVLVNKPKGGVWACPVNSRRGWERFCRSEEFNLDKLDKFFKFKLKPEGKIYQIDNFKDLQRVSTKFSQITSNMKCLSIDFDELMMRQGYDGVYVTENALGIYDRWDTNTNVCLKGLELWDVESICVFNPDVIEPIEDEPMQMNDDELKQVVTEGIKRVLQEYLDNNLIGPLRNYLKRGRKKYDQDSFRKLYYDYQVGNKDITSRNAFDKYEVFKNGWVLHFTNYPFDILMNGFKGLDKEMMPQLWRTFARGLPMSDEEGYAFAFDANDKIPDSSIRYGKYALMFRTSGLKVHNLGDLGQWQVIFNSKMANMKQCFLLRFDTKTESYFDGNGDVDSSESVTGVSVINPSTKKAVYKAGTIEDAVAWVQQNYQQYSGTNVFNNIPKMSASEANAKAVVNKLIEFFNQNCTGNKMSYQETHGMYEDTYFLYDTGLRVQQFKQFFDYMNKGNLSFHFGYPEYRGQLEWKNKFGQKADTSEVKQITITRKRGGFE